MARSRSLPTALFDEPDFFELDSDAQIMLIGLVLGADDHGRGLAHVGWLARKLNKPEPTVTSALATLQQRRLLLCYQDERQQYYALIRWTEWEDLHKPARSKYPAPPQENSGEAQSPPPSELSPENPGTSELPPETLGESRKPTLEEEGEEEKEEEGEEEEEGLRSNVVTFPAANAASEEDQLGRDLMTQVARILKLGPSEALLRIVHEYRTDAHISLLGEADAAREWIDDSRRNHRSQRMTPAFFRRWLKREREGIQQRQALHRAAGGEPADTAHAASSRSSPGPARRSLMHLEAEYRTKRTQGGC